MVDLIESMEEQLLTLQGEDGVGIVCRLLGLFPYEGKQFALLLNLGEQGVKGDHRISDPAYDMVPVFKECPSAQELTALDNDEELDKLESDGKVRFIENDLPVQIVSELEQAAVQVEIERGELEGQKVWVARGHLTKEEPISTVLEFYIKGNLRSADGLDSVPMFPLPPGGEALKASQKADVDKLYSQGAHPLENGTAIHVFGSPNQEAIQVMIREGSSINKGGWVAHRHLYNDKVVFNTIQDDQEFDRVRAYVLELAQQMEDSADAEEDAE